jgi:hypothetical protein
MRIGKEIIATATRLETFAKFSSILVSSGRRMFCGRALAVQRRVSSS